MFCHLVDKYHTALRRPHLGLSTITTSRLAPMCPMSHFKGLHTCTQASVVGRQRKLQRHKEGFKPFYFRTKGPCKPFMRTTDISAKGNTPSFFLPGARHSLVVIVFVADNEHCSVRQEQCLTKPVAIPSYLVFAVPRYQGQNPQTRLFYTAEGASQSNVEY